MAMYAIAIAPMRHASTLSLAAIQRQLVVSMFAFAGMTRTHRLVAKHIARLIAHDARCCAADGFNAERSVSF
jgi:uncharacterized protein (DUF697 family)